MLYITVQYYDYVVAVIWLMFGGTCAVIADGRGRNGLAWFLLGLMFTFFALVAVCALPQEEKPDNSKALPVKPNAQRRRTQQTSPHLAALIAEGEKNAAKMAAIKEKEKVE
jgi:hypothetical protein